MSWKQPSRAAMELERKIDYLQQVIDGLRGKPFEWPSGAYKPGCRALAGHGYTLTTRTAAEKKGYKLLPRAKRIGQAYFTKPISKYCDLYLLEVHFWKVPQDND